MTFESHRGRGPGSVGVTVTYSNNSQVFIYKLVEPRHSDWAEPGPEPGPGRVTSRRRHRPRAKSRLSDSLATRVPVARARSEPPRRSPGRYPSRKETEEWPVTVPRLPP